MSVVEQHHVEDDPSRANFPHADPVTPWRLKFDPFTHASPVVDLAVLTGGLPDARDADEILRDLADCRKKRARR